AARAGLALVLDGVVPHRALPAILAEADCFVLPSLTEGHPKALIEAMAAGLPCAASARGGIPTLLTDGATGLLFDPERRDDIARSVRRLLTDASLARRLGAAARATAVASYDASVLLGAEAAFVRAAGAGDSVTQMFEDYAQAFPIEDVLPEFLVPRLEALARQGARAVLDLGAGDGRWLAFFRRLLPPDALVVGCEISHLRARRIKEKGFHVVVAQTEALPFREAAFDLVSLIEVIEHTQSPAQSLSEIRRTLRRGGRLVLTTPNYPVKRLYDARAALRARSLGRLKDDPTHISPLGARRLARLLVERFESVTLEGAAVLGEGRSAWIRRLKATPLGTRISNKLYAVCAKER
ncbi:MAG TPA: glycosyltransferase, partial [Solirubrobacteraceae bacterium]